MYKDKVSQLPVCTCFRLWFINEYDAHGLVYVYVLVCVVQQSRPVVTSVHLDDVVVAAGSQQVFPVGGDAEVARMFACRLVACGRQRTFLRVDGEDGYAVVLQAVAGIEELSVRTDVYVGTAACSRGIGCDGLYRGQPSGFVGEGSDAPGQFADEVGVTSVRRERQVPGA